MASSAGEREPGAWVVATGEREEVNLDLTIVFIHLKHSGYISHGRVGRSKDRLNELLAVYRDSQPALFGDSTIRTIPSMVRF